MLREPADQKNIHTRMYNHSRLKRGRDPRFAPMCVTSPLQKLCLLTRAYPPLYPPSYIITLDPSSSLSPALIKFNQPKDLRI